MAPLDVTQTEGEQHITKNCEKWDEEKYQTAI